VLHRDRFRHQPHRRLRGIVRHVDPLAADDAGDQGQIDDRPASVGDHCRNGVLDAKEPAGRIDGHDAMSGIGAVKILFGAAGDAGIVDQDIRLAELPPISPTTASPFSSLVTSKAWNRAAAPMASATCRPS